MAKRRKRPLSPSAQAFSVISPILLGGIPVFLLISYAPELKIWFLILYFVYLTVLSLVYAALVIPPKLRRLKDLIGEEAVYKLYPLLRHWDRLTKARRERRALRHPL